VFTLIVGPHPAVGDSDVAIAGWLIRAPIWRRSTQMPLPSRRTLAHSWKPGFLPCH